MATSGSPVYFATTASETFSAAVGATQTTFLFTNATAPPNWPFGLAISRSVAGLGSNGVAISGWIVGGWDSTNPTAFTLAGPAVLASTATAATGLAATATAPPLMPFWGVKVQVQDTAAFSCSVGFGIYVTPF